MVRARPAPAEAGFTYLGLLFAVALAGIALAGTGSLWSLESRRQKEQELLFIGEQYRAAIGRYYDQAPNGAHVYPERLEDLLQDPRFPVPVRHLRRLYRDPMSNAHDWDLIRAGGRITGIASNARDKPVKVAGFAGNQEDFASAKTYNDWHFVHGGGTAELIPTPTPTPSPGPALSAAPKP